MDCWQRNSASCPGQLSVTLRDVEEGAVNLQRVGEAVAVLKGQCCVKMWDVQRWNGSLSDIVFLPRSCI